MAASKRAGALHSIGVILAGGQGRRMGGTDKALLPLAGKPLIRHVLNRLRLQVPQVLISANGDPARFAGMDCEVVADRNPEGPLSGILAAMHRAAALGATHVLSVPVDAPFLPTDLLARLVAAARGAPGGLALAGTPGQLHPTFGLWPVTLAPALAAFLAEGNAKMMQFADRQGAATALFADPSGFLNLNTPDDLAQAEALLAGAA
jgi:molybdopterin-guanine dinucleotide biosynthesis protein A